MCGCLESLQRTSNIFVTNNDATKIEPAIASKCLVVIRKLEKETKIVSMNTKLHSIVREFLSIKIDSFSSLKFIKVDAHQDDVKSFDRLTFFEQLNVTCDLRAKKLITNIASYEIIPFPLTLNLEYVMNADN